MLKVVNSSPNKTSMDHSGINFALVKECISFLAIPISHIANISFKMGIFPDRMKIAKVIPILKSELKDSFTVIYSYISISSGVCYGNFNV